MHNLKANLGVFAFALAIAACTNTNTSAEFIGTWNYSPGQTELVSCDGTSSTESVSGSLVIAMGVNAPLTWTGGDCDLQFEVNGDIATAQIGQSCSDTQNGTTTVIDFTSVSMTIGNPATTLTEQLMATASLSGSASGTCTLSATNTLTKVAN